MRMALYCRVSTRDGRQTTDNQEIILEQYAKEHGWEYSIFREEQSTRKTRPIKDKLIDALKNKYFDGVCVLKLDRWGRSINELIGEITELHNLGIVFISVRDNIDLSTATGRLQFNILSSFAEFERDLTQERVYDGLERAKAEGKHLGRPKGAKDRSKRITYGYLLREAKKRAQKKGKIHDVQINPSKKL